MKWIYRSLMATSVIGASLVTAGIVPMAFAVVFTSVAGAAAFFHDAPGATKP